MKIKPLYDRVVLSSIKQQEKTVGGIMLPEVAQQKSQFAEVVAVGAGGNLDGKETKMQLKVGDKVIYSKFAGTDIKIDDKDYIIIRQTDVLAVLGD
ncbi:MAG: co-chaperone GroES [Clostridia bacterium]|nr:co-chaperone GroES [Clostridia bacterium]